MTFHNSVKNSGIGRERYLLSITDTCTSPCLLTASASEGQAHIFFCVLKNFPLLLPTLSRTSTVSPSICSFSSAHRYILASASCTHKTPPLVHTVPASFCPIYLSLIMTKLLENFLESFVHTNAVFTSSYYWHINSLTHYNQPGDLAYLHLVKVISDFHVG